MNLIRGDDTYNLVRVIVYTPKNDQAQYMSNTNPGLHGPLDYDKYKIWVDRQVLLDADEHSQLMKFRLNLRNMRVRYGNTGGTIQNQGNLKMFIVSDSTTSPHPTANGYCTLTYTDG